MLVFRTVWVDDECDGKLAMGKLIKLNQKFVIDGVVGLPCSAGEIAICITLIRVLLQYNFSVHLSKNYYFSKPAHAWI
jgi:hypothetical protein